MSILDFIPHTLKRRKVTVVDKPSSTPALEAQSPTAPSSSKPPTSQTTSHIAPPRSTDRPQKETAQAVKPSWEFAFLVWLALSDYSLWTDGDLRRRMDSASELNAPRVREENPTVNTNDDDDDDDDSMVVDEKEARDEQGYVPLDHILTKADVFRLVSNIHPYCDAKETTYVTSLRQFAIGAIDVRFLIDSESSATRAALTSRWTRLPPPQQSGYEVRRADLAPLRDSEFSRYNKHRWDALTVYMENIPKPYAQVPGIGKLITALLPASSGAPMKRVQNVVFPPHHQDLPGSIPICKGFALVTLSSEDDVEALVAAWPWDSEKHADPVENNQSAEERSARASGLRICTKARWEALRAEYLIYRQQLVAEINQNQDEEEAHRMGEGPFKDDREVAAPASGSKRKQPECTAQNEAGPEIHPDSPYPTACLVFVRHIHHETNKTTLRMLFSQAWAAEIDNAIDYIDYSKNTDSCYVRFGTPAHAKLFVDYFSSRRIAQCSGLDGNGSESLEVRQPSIVAEVVLGKREEVYWDKVPEKLRRQAVEKTMRAMRGPRFVGGSGSGVGLRGEGVLQKEGDGGRKKRRRKGKTLD